MLSIDRIALHVARGHWGRAGLPQPEYGPVQWYAAAQRLRVLYGADPFTPPEEIARVERLHLEWRANTGTCGVSIRRLLMVPIGKTRDASWLSFHHERGHAHEELVGGNEADVWGFTLEIALPRLPMDQLLRVAVANDVKQELLEARFGQRALARAAANDTGPYLEEVMLAIEGAIPGG